MTNPSQTACTSLSDCEPVLKWIDGTAFTFEAWMDDIPVTGSGPNYAFHSAAIGFLSQTYASIMCQGDESECAYGKLTYTVLMNGNCSNHFWPTVFRL